jgi:hypothetical protein
MQVQAKRRRSKEERNNEQVAAPDPSHEIVDPDSASDESCTVTPTKSSPANI